VCDTEKGKTLTCKTDSSPKCGKAELTTAYLNKKFITIQLEIKHFHK
jgi:hypothetical protein